MIRPTGRRAPDGFRLGWRNFNRTDRAEFLTWSIWVTCIYLAVAAGLLFLAQCNGDVVPLLVHVLAYHVPINDAVGIAASIAVLITFLMPTMLLLRLVVIISNVLFVAYGYLGHIYPVLLLHLVLLPINLKRVVWREHLSSNGK